MPRKKTTKEETTEQEHKIRKRRTSVKTTGKKESARSKPRDRSKIVEEPSLEETKEAMAEIPLDATLEPVKREGEEEIKESIPSAEQEVPKLVPRIHPHPELIEAYVSSKSGEISAPVKPAEEEKKEEEVAPKEMEKNLLPEIPLSPAKSLETRYIRQERMSPRYDSRPVSRRPHHGHQSGKPPIHRQDNRTHQYPRKENNSNPPYQESRNHIVETGEDISISQPSMITLGNGDTIPADIGILKSYSISQPHRNCPKTRH